MANSGKVVILVTSALACVAGAAAFQITRSRAASALMSVSASASASVSASAPASVSASAPASASVSASASAIVPASAPADEPVPQTLEEQRQALFRTLSSQLDFTAQQVQDVKAIIEASPVLGQGNPAITKHPMTRAECRKIRADAGLVDAPHPPCRRRNMVPVYDPEVGETAANARVCIDQFEYPGIACEYPVVYASAREAALLCKASGKRLCDAHEWEGACAGSVRKPEVEYAFGEPRPYATWLHNEARAIRWAYGADKNHALCATASWKSPKCQAGGWTLCGSNTYPAGAFPACVSPFGVYDQHGNAAEHMNLPLAPGELASAGGAGATEMKGSWFIFVREEAHDDDCRWRAKDWHPSTLMDVESHRNYHLGFRCCADVEPAG
jgi:sulfatase modifying factor 1